MENNETESTHPTQKSKLKEENSQAHQTMEYNNKFSCIRFHNILFRSFCHQYRLSNKTSNLLQNVGTFDQL